MSNYNFITLDRLKVSVPSKFIKVMNHRMFINTTTSSGSVLSQTYSSEFNGLPFLLMIKVKLNTLETVIELSSKCLLDRYSELISLDNIYDVFESIRDLNIIDFEIEDLITNAQVLSCDVTEDRHEILTDRQIQIMNLAVKKANWVSQPYPNGLLFVKRNKAGKRVGQSITIYNKEIEIIGSNNFPFLNSLDDPQKLINHFIGVTRYEMKLTSKRAILSTLNITESTLLTVLSTNIGSIDRLLATIIDPDLAKQNDSFLDDINSFAHGKGKRALDNYKNHLLCKECNYDMNKIRVVVSSLISDKTNLKVACKPYQKILVNFFNETVT